MLIMGLASIVLIGGGAGGYFYFMQPAQASAGDEAKKAHDSKEKDEHAKLEYVELDPLILPIVDNDGVSQIVSLVVSLEIEKPENVAKVNEMTPRLKDAYIQDMYGALNRHAALKGGVIQVGVIKKRLNKVTDDVMGDSEIVHDVLLQVVQQRPI